jgi:site-specific recombinase XerD
MTHQPIQTLVDEYIDWCINRRGLRPLTTRQYSATLKHFARQFADTDMHSLLPEDVEAFARRPLRNGNQPAAPTARREQVAVVKFMEWCVARKEMNLRGHLLTVAPKVKMGVPKPISDDVWRHLWMSDSVCPDDRLWLGLGYFCGFRRFEMVTIRPPEIHIDTKVMQFERKGGGFHTLDYLAMTASVGERLPWLAEGWEDWMGMMEAHSVQRHTEARLCVYAHADDPFLDGNRLSKRLGRVLSHAGLESTSFTLHQLRHSCATNLFRAGWPPEVVQKALSHSSFEITKGYMDVAGHMRAKLTERGAL